METITTAEALIDPALKSTTGSDLVALSKLRRDVRASATFLDRAEIASLVDLYYRTQEHRIALGNQVSSLSKAGRPTSVVEHFHSQLSMLERQVTSTLEAWTDSYPAGVWAKSQVGIGAVLAAAAIAKIDVNRAKTAGGVWRYFGLDPSVKWEKGSKRPWDADAKVLAWKIGDSFVKVSGRTDAFYGKVYRDRKEYEVARDLSGGNAKTAAETLVTKNFKDKPTREIYESGHLPPGRLDLRARRYAAKLFLAHLWEVMYREEFGCEPPMPYPIAHLGHVHHIAPPGY